jgi:hypothetical protein
MSALGQKQTFRSAIVMSALPPKATSTAKYGMSAKDQKRTIQMVHYPPHKLSRASRVELIS